MRTMLHGRITREGEEGRTKIQTTSLRTTTRKEGDLRTTIRKEGDPRTTTRAIKIKAIITRVNTSNRDTINIKDTNRTKISRVSPSKKETKELTSKMEEEVEGEEGVHTRSSSMMDPRRGWASSSLNPTSPKARFHRKISSPQLRLKGLKKRRSKRRSMLSL